VIGEGCKRIELRVNDGIKRDLAGQTPGGEDMWRKLRKKLKWKEIRHGDEKH